MDAILQLPPTLPPHDAAPVTVVPHRVVASWPAGTFVENLVVLDDRSIVVSVLSEARLDRIANDGDVTVLRQFDAPPTGLALVDGALFVAVGEPGGSAPTLWRLDPLTGNGEPWMTLDGLTFANGVTPFAPSELLIAESWHGQLCRVELAEKRVSVWIEDEPADAGTGDRLPAGREWREAVRQRSNG